jgi:hypothetical protein
VEDTIAALQYSHTNKLAFPQKSECPIDCRARNGWIPVFHHLAKVSGGKGLLGSKDRLDDHSAADAIARKMFKLRRHTLV